MQNFVRLDLQRRFRAYLGVIDVTGWAGKTRQYPEVEFDLNKPDCRQVYTLPQVIQVLQVATDQRGRHTRSISARSRRWCAASD